LVALGSGGDRRAVVSRFANAYVWISCANGSAIIEIRA
jgi:hypothetical protein